MEPPKEATREEDDLANKDEAEDNVEGGAVTRGEEEEEGREEGRKRRGRVLCRHVVNK